MLANEQVESLITTIACMPRQSLVDAFRSDAWRFPIDLSDDFLQNQSVEKLRHVYMALCLQHDRMPGAIAA